MIERELPVSEYCQIFREWAGLIHERARTAEEGYDKDRWQSISDAIRVVELAIVKSNYLWRRLYANDPHRTVPCPIHKGHWSGCVYGEDMCPEGCQHGYDVTGWLPEPHTYLEAPEDVEPVREGGKVVKMGVTYCHTRCYRCGGKPEAAIHDR